MTSPPPLICLDAQALDRLMPMHLVVLPSGHISQAAPTLQKLCPDARLVGRRFLEVFEIRRPRRGVINAGDLHALAGENLRLQFRKNPQSVLKAILVGLPDDGGFLINLSFGLSVIEAVREYDLTNGDFAPTDLAIEMLYLVEAKTAVMDESRRLNDRLQSARLAAEEQASTDMLTGLRNRRAMDRSLAGLASHGTQFALMHLDLDYFKAVNDTHGHAAGDHVLQAAAQVLLDETRHGDIVARVGGDEFVLIFPDLVDEARLSRIANRIVKRLEEPVTFKGKTCRISGSIGFTTSRLYDAPDLDQMLSDADLALYASKHKGRACTTMVTPDLLKASRNRRDHALDPGPEPAPRGPS